jgi:hypothetical protein
MVNEKLEVQATINYFFAKEKANTWRCKNKVCKKICIQKDGKGYSNLKSHLANCIGDYEEYYRSKGND